MVTSIGESTKQAPPAIPSLLPDILRKQRKNKVIVPKKKARFPPFKVEALDSRIERRNRLKSQLTNPKRNPYSNSSLHICRLNDQSLKSFMAKRKANKSYMLANRKHNQCMVGVTPEIKKPSALLIVNKT